MEGFGEVNGEEGVSEVDKRTVVHSSLHSAVDLNRIDDVDTLVNVDRTVPDQYEGGVWGGAYEIQCKFKRWNRRVCLGMSEP